MADLTFTTIEESARHALNISRDEYAACNYVQTWAAYPSNKTPGFCNRTRGQMAAFIGISERGMQKMLSRLEAMELIKRASQSQFLYRITEKWFEVVVAAKEQRTGEQSSRQRVNKVPAVGEQSSRQGVNKVPTHKELNNEVYKTTTKEKNDVAVFDPEVNALIVESFEFKAEEVERGTVAPPAAARRFDPFDIDTATVELKENEFSAENFARITGTPAAQMFARFSSEVDAFVLEQKGRKTVYNRFDEFSGHFFNWSRSRSRVRARSIPGASTSQQAPPANYQTSTRY